VPYAICSVKDGDTYKGATARGFEGREVVSGVDWKG